MRLEIPSLGLGLGLFPGSPPGRGAAHWQPLTLPPTAASADGTARASDADDARYFERLEPPSAQTPGPAPPARGAAPCILIVSPLLPLPRSLASLIAEALASEPDFRIDWKWPVLTPRVGPWELVVQLCVGTSLETGHATGRVYAALDAGFGAYLLVCIDRDPQKLAERHKELLGLLAAARLHRDRVPEAETALAPDEAASLAGKGAAAPTEIIPPQQPPPEIYLKEALFSYLTD